MEAVAHIQPFWTIQNVTSKHTSSTPAWAIFKDGILSTDLAEPPAELKRLLSKLPPPTPQDNRSFGIVDPKHARFYSAQSVCPFLHSQLNIYEQTPTPRGNWEIACGLAMGEIPALVSRWAGDRHCKTLADSLNRKYKCDRSPERTKVPGPVDPEIAIQEAARKEKADRRNAILDAIAGAVGCDRKAAEVLAVAVGSFNALGGA